MEMVEMIEAEDWKPKAQGWVCVYWLKERLLSSMEFLFGTQNGKMWFQIDLNWLILYIFAFGMIVFNFGMRVLFSFQGSNHDFLLLIPLLVRLPSRSKSKIQTNRIQEMAKTPILLKTRWVLPIMTWSIYFYVQNGLKIWYQHETLCQFDIIHLDIPWGVPLDLFKFVTPQNLKKTQRFFIHFQI